MRVTELEIYTRYNINVYTCDASSISGPFNFITNLILLLFYL